MGVMDGHPLLEEVEASALADAMAGPDAPLLVDVRTDAERALAAIQPSRHLGLDRFVQAAPQEIPKDRDVVVYCHVGARSAQAMKDPGAGPLVWSISIGRLLGSRPALVACQLGG